MEKVLIYYTILTGKRQTACQVDIFPLFVCVSHAFKVFYFFSSTA